MGRSHGGSDLPTRDGRGTNGILNNSKRHHGPPLEQCTSSRATIASRSADLFPDDGAVRLPATQASEPWFALEAATRRPQPTATGALHRPSDWSPHTSMYRRAMALAANRPERS